LSFYHFQNPVQADNLMENAHFFKKKPEVIFMLGDFDMNIIGNKIPFVLLSNFALLEAPSYGEKQFINDKQK
jgi:hypothetical protein